MICAVACGIVLMIAPERSEGTKRCVRLAVSLVMLCAIIRPIANIAEDIPDVLEYADRMIPDEDRDDGSTEDVVVSAICTAAEYDEPDIRHILQLLGNLKNYLRPLSRAEISCVDDRIFVPVYSEIIIQRIVLFLHWLNCIYINPIGNNRNLIFRHTFCYDVSLESFADRDNPISISICIILCFSTDFP